MAATPTTKVQISWSDRSPIPMVNIYADTPQEADELVNYVDQNYATWVAVGQASVATLNVVKTMGATAVSTPPAAAGQALPQPVQPAESGASHPCGAEVSCGQSLKLRNGKFGQFYSCPKRMDDPTRCKKTINVQ